MMRTSHWMSWEEEEGHQRASTACWSAAHKGVDISACSSPPVNIEATCIPAPRTAPTFLSVILLVLVPVVIITALPHNRTYVTTNVQRMALSTSQESDSYYLHFLYFSNALRKQECGRNTRAAAQPFNNSTIRRLTHLTEVDKGWWVKTFASELSNEHH